MMDTFAKQIAITGTILIILGIILGAFGAHGLLRFVENGRIEPKLVNSFETGVKYQLYTGIALLALSLFAQFIVVDVKWAFRLILVGMILFSGSIYGMVVQGIVGIKPGTFIGPITPIGGLLMIVGWTFFLFSLLKVTTK